MATETKRVAHRTEVEPRNASDEELISYHMNMEHLMLLRGRTELARWHRLSYQDIAESFTRNTPRKAWRKQTAA